MVFRNKVYTTELNGSSFEDIHFQKCRFEGSSKFTSFVRCTFTACDLSMMLGEESRFVSCSFPESKLSFFDFANVVIKDCDFSHGLLEECMFQQFKSGSHLERKSMDLRTCKFEKTNLTRSMFIRCNVSEVSFKGSNLDSVGFDRCQLIKTNLKECTVQGTGFTNCTINNVVMDIDGFIQYGNSQGFTLTNEI